MMSLRSRHLHVETSRSLLLLPLTFAQLVVFLFAGPISGADQPEVSSSKMSRPVVILVVPEPEKKAYQKLLVRELIRQSFLLAAREEFHAATRDLVLRESVREQSPDQYTFQIDVESAKEDEIRPSLTSLDVKQVVKPWEAVIQAADEHQLEEVLKAAEKWSREDFVAVLKSAKVPVGEIPSAAKSEEEPGETVPLEFVAQIGRLRELHAALLQEPKSPLLLARITEHYALLGSLTAIHWGAESKVFHARSLLYGERALHFHPDNALVAWSRGLAFGLCGRHDLAKGEITRARSLDKPDEAPAWSESLEYFVTWNKTELARCAEEEQELAAYFQFLASEVIGTGDERIRAITALMQNSSECFRAAYVMSVEPQIGLQRSVGGTQFQQFLVSFPDSLLELKGLPKSVEEVARSLAENPDSERMFQMTADLVEKLHDIPAADDRSEPSLSMLSTLAGNLHFLHAVQILHTHQWSLGISTNAVRPIFKELLRNHPAVGFVEVFSADSGALREAYQKVIPELHQLPVTDAAWETCRRLVGYGVSEQNGLFNQIRAQRDDVLCDLKAKFDDTVAPKSRPKAAELMERVAPDCPAWIVANIRLDWKKARSRAAEWEEKFSIPIVLEALATQYSITSANNPEDREAAGRCWKNLAEIEPSFRTYRLLAQHFLHTGDREKWKQTLQDSLKFQSFGLESAGVNQELADWYMSQRDFVKARPFAMAAADSYSSWGLMCGARCLEGLQDWEECEKLVRANAERYGSAWFEWYLWCRRTGHGDLEAAREYCLQVTAKYSPMLRNSSEELAMFLLMEGSQVEALPIIQQLDTRDSSGYWAIHAALITEEEELTKDRNVILDRQINSGRDVFAPWLAVQLARPKQASPAPFNAAEAQFCYDFAFLSGNATNTAYFIGKALLLRDREDEAVHWLQTAASSPKTNKWNCVLAIEELRRLEKEIPEKREHELDPKYDEAFKFISSALSMRQAEDMEKAVQAATRALKASPDWGLALYACARAHSYAKNYEESEKSYTRLLEQQPGEPFFLNNRARIREQLKKFDEAKADYLAASAATPQYKLPGTLLKVLEKKQK